MWSIKKADAINRQFSKDEIQIANKHTKIVNFVIYQKNIDTTTYNVIVLGEEDFAFFKIWHNPWETDHKLVQVPFPKLSGT